MTRTKLIEALEGMADIEYYRDNLNRLQITRVNNAVFSVEKSQQRDAEMLMRVILMEAEGKFDDPVK